MSERENQRAFIQWLDLRGILYCHVPNGGSRNLIEARALKLDGVKAGVPDILVFSHPTNNPEFKFRGAAIEMKKRGGKVSTKQTEWLMALENVGWYCVVAYSVKDAINEMKRLGF